MDWCGAKDVTEMISGGLTSLGVLAAGWWFLYTTQFKPRIQFDLSCRFLPLDPTQHTYLAEVSLIFENKGFVEHRMYDLELSIHGLAEGTSGQSFARPLFPRAKIVPARYEFYFVRPGIQQIIVHPVIIEAPGPIIRITSGFNYERRIQWPHTVRRFFSVPSMSEFKTAGEASNPAARADC
jgi:hypothetical protein